MSYKHLSITERELLLIHLTQGLSLCRIARLRATLATTCRAKRKRVTAGDGKNVPRQALVAPTNQQSSQVRKYRAIYAGIFDTPEQKRSEGNRGARRKLRHRGKPRRPKGYVSNRGKIPISHELSERPFEANKRR